MKSSYVSNAANHQSEPVDLAPTKDSDSPRVLEQVSAKVCPFRFRRNRSGRAALDCGAIAIEEQTLSGYAIKCDMR